MKHLLNTQDLSLDEALLILDTAEAMAETQSRQMKKLPALRGRTVVNLFFEDSTRTRISFEAAAKRLSALSLSPRQACAPSDKRLSTRSLFRPCIWRRSYLQSMN